MRFPIHYHRLNENDQCNYDRTMAEGISVLDDSVTLPKPLDGKIEHLRDSMCCLFCGKPASEGDSDVRMVITQPIRDSVCITQAGYCSACGAKHYGSQLVKQVGEDRFMVRFRDYHGNVHYHIVAFGGRFKIWGLRILFAVRKFFGLSNYKYNP